MKDTEQKEKLENIFQELAESEDEKIKKELIAIFKGEIPYTSKEDADRYISWIEKQGDLGSADKSESKFHEGDWITHNTANFVFKIINVGSNSYEVVNRDNYKKTISFDCEDNYHLWTIADAKDGDVLVMYDIQDNIEWLFLYRPNPHKLRINDPRFYCHYDLKSNTFKKDADYVSVAIGTKFSPATKEQCDLLFEKMKAAGYEWNVEMKYFLNKIALKKLDADEVIDWIYKYWAFSWGNFTLQVDDAIEKFKNDFEL